MKRDHKSDQEIADALNESAGLAGRGLLTGKKIWKLWRVLGINPIALKNERSLSTYSKRKQTQAA